MAHGNVGVAMLGCKNINTLLMLAEKFVPLAFSALNFSVQQDGENSTFTIRAETGFPNLDIAVTEAILGTVLLNLSRLSGETIKPKGVSIAYQKPFYFLSYDLLLQCSVEFSCAETVLTFSNYQMALPIQTADSLGGALLVEQCQQDLTRIEHGSSFTVRITEIVNAHLASSPSIKFVASKLQISERSLRRRLAEKDVNFRELVKGVRHDKAMYLLEKTDIRIDKISYELGYKETASFRRAFKKQIGLSPRDWRKERID
jgi:AraC-like DNA-binding protein